MKKTILAINPGSTSTKFAVYKNSESIIEHTISHRPDEFDSLEKVNDQFYIRKNAVLDYLIEHKFDVKELSAVIGRGGGVRPIEGGTYLVNEKMLNDLKEAKRGEHASNLGGIIANAIAETLGIPAYIADPPVVDELADLARVSGLNGCERESKFHALNQKAVAKRYAYESDKIYESLNVVVAHLGGGISVGAHEKGKVVDVNDAFTGDGSFSPERAGGLPTGAILRIALSGKYTQKEIVKMLVGKGGVFSYLGVTDMREVEALVRDGDSKAKLIYEAMAYQIAKDIGAMSTVLKGQIDQIIFTGGIAYDEKFIALIAERVKHLAEITVYPGENELEALVLGALGVLTGEIDVKVY